MKKQPKLFKGLDPESLYSMELHERYVDGYDEIIRVPGGFLYKLTGTTDEYVPISVTAVFVPFDGLTELMGKKKRGQRKTKPK